jgi:hypothetical protein
MSDVFGIGEKSSGRPCEEEKRISSAKEKKHQTSFLVSLAENLKTFEFPFGHLFGREIFFHLPQALFMPSLHRKNGHRFFMWPRHK